MADVDLPELTRSTVLATMRTVLGWMVDGQCYENVEDAIKKVERWQPGDDWSCPVCEEVECDSDCPMLPIRVRPGPLQLREPSDGEVLEFKDKLARLGPTRVTIIDDERFQG